MFVFEKPKARLSFIVLSCLFLSFVILSFYTLNVEFNSPEAQKHFVSEDSMHFLNGAKELISGNFHFHYITRYPHREILYAATLAVPLYFFGENLYALGTVNIFFFCLAGVFAFLAVKKLYDDNVAAFFAVALLLFNKFTLFNVTYGLLTEGMFIACIVAAIYFFLSYLKSFKTIDLLLLSAICGIAQGVRPNGFFLYGAFLVVVMLRLAFLKKKHGHDILQNKKRLTGVLLASCGAFLLFSLPSWGPRVYFFGDPLYHGYLTNFLWEDNYDLAHDADLVFTFQDYVSYHTLGDMLPRILLGLKKSYLSYPLDHMSVFVWLALVVGFVVAVWQKNKDMLLLAATLFIVMAPVVWTVISNPTPRIGFAFTLPFAVFLGTNALVFMRRRLNAWKSAKRSRRRSTKKQYAFPVSVPQQAEASEESEATISATQSL